MNKRLTKRLIPSACYDIFEARGARERKVIKITIQPQIKIAVGNVPMTKVQI